jgi:hypothetical protein
MVTNMDTWRQVDVVGSLRATWAHRPAPLGRHPAPKCFIGTVHITDSWEMLHKLSEVLI